MSRGRWSHYLIATATPNSSSPRFGAIVHTAMFDAYNGIERRYHATGPRVACRQLGRQRRSLTGQSMVEAETTGSCASISKYSSPWAKGRPCQASKAG